ncbi:MAG: 5'/3'-nucleotidase SurE [Rhizomicrobium sp.]
MRILVTNDDGIHAPGLVAAENIARALCDDVWVVAPETEQSGASHSLTLTMPLRLREIEKRRFAVSGTPTDCVMMAIAHVMTDKAPDLVLSGVNRGSNMADDVTYSGTIAGAMEGCALGIASIAMSQSYGLIEGAQIRWDCGEIQGPPLIRKLVEIGWPDDVLMNINFPDAAPGEVKGIDICSQGNATCRPRRWTGASTRVAIPISGSASNACAPIRRRAPTCMRSTTSASRSRRCTSTSPSSRCSRR